MVDSTNKEDAQEVDPVPEENKQAQASGEGGRGGAARVPTEDAPERNNPGLGGGLIKPVKQRPKIQGRKKPGRGFGLAGATDVVDSLSCDDIWDCVQEFCEEHAEERDELIEHFNTLIPGEDDLGSILFSEKADMNEFGDRIKLLDEANQKTYCDELQSMEILVFPPDSDDEGKD